MILQHIVKKGISTQHHYLDAFMFVCKELSSYFKQMVMKTMEENDHVQLSSQLVLQSISFEGKKKRKKMKKPDKTVIFYI